MASVVVLAAGPLLLFDRGDPLVNAFLLGAHRKFTDLVIPAAALAQVWRGPMNARVANLIRSSRVISMDEEIARRSGVLCALTGTSDVVDASVVAVAEIEHASILTSDPDDIARLAGRAIGCGPVLDVTRIPRRRP